MSYLDTFPSSLHPPDRSHQDEFHALTALGPLPATLRRQDGGHAADCGARRALRAELARWLPDAGIGYRWEAALGGFRRLPPDSPDTALRNESFRAYAAHMRTASFAAAMAALVADARTQPVAAMCSESVWWRCHRRLIADHAVLLDALPVHHIMPDGRLVEHQLTGGVRVQGEVLFYDVG